MKLTNIAVCVKPVPDPQYYDQVKIDPIKKTIIRSSVPTIINPVDKNALQAALNLREKEGGHVLVFSMAPMEAAESIKSLLAMGADAGYLLSDRSFAGSDTLATSYILAAAIRQYEKLSNNKIDLVMCGNESADGATGQVSSQLGELLEMPHLLNVSYLERNIGVSQAGTNYLVHTKKENGFMEWSVKSPVVLGVSREINTPKFTTVMDIIKAKNKKLIVWTLADIKALDDNLIGLHGSPTKAGVLFEPNLKRSGMIIKGSAEDIASSVINILQTKGISVRVN